MGKYKYLTLEDRKALQRMYNAGDSPAKIAKLLGVHEATIYRELKRGSRMVDGTMQYDPAYGHDLVLKHFKKRGYYKSRRENGKQDA